MNSCIQCGVLFTPKRSEQRWCSKSSARAKKREWNRTTLRWMAVDSLSAALENANRDYRLALKKVERLPRRERGGPPLIRDRNLIRALDSWLDSTVIPEIQLQIAYGLVQTSWALVSARATPKEAISQAMCHRRDSWPEEPRLVERELKRLLADRDPDKLEMLAHRLYCVLAEDSFTGLPPDTNNRRKGPLSRLIHDLNPFIADEEDE